MAIAVVLHENNAKNENAGKNCNFAAILLRDARRAVFGFCRKMAIFQIILRGKFDLAAKFAGTSLFKTLQFCIAREGASDVA